MTSEGSVTRWIERLQEGDPEAAQKLWERYFHRLVGLARVKLGSCPRPAADEEDVALSAFATFCRNAERGRFPQLLDSDGLWRLLVLITARKAAHLVRDQQRQKRGGRLSGSSEESKKLRLEEILSQEPSPEFAAEAAEECRRLLELLGDADLESVAVLKMQGYTVEELAEQRKCAPRSVKRKLRLIRDLWSKEVTP